MVGTVYDDLLTQLRHIPLGQFRVIIFLIRITFNYLWASVVLKVNYFHLPIHLANELLLVFQCENLFVYQTT